MTDEGFQGRTDRRKGERRKQQLPFDGPERRRGRDRRRYVRKVMSGETPLPDVNGHDTDPRRSGDEA